MAKALLEIVEHHDPTGNEIVYRFPPEGSSDIKMGAQLVVQQSQEAVIFRDGRALDVFGPGRHTLVTQNVPLLTKLLGLPFGGTSPFRVAVVFVNKRTFMDQKWGTREPVVFRDTELGMVRLRAFGNYAYRVADSQLFVNTVVGSLGYFDTDRLRDFYRDIIVSRLNDLLGETLKTIFDLARYYDELGTAGKARLAEDFAKYGVDLTDFYINSITPPEEVQKRIDERAAMGAIGNMNTYMQFKAAQAMHEAAQAGGDGGGAGAGLGLGLGAGFGAMMPGMIAQSMYQAQYPGAPPPAGPVPGAVPPAAAPAAPAAPAGGAAAAAPPPAGDAAAAGAATGPLHKFCFNCGNKLAIEGAKFCPNCGTKLG